jgi:hypothetical protein
MAFKSAEDRTAEIYKNKFHLDNDGDTADVIIMYQKSHDALIGDMHYVKSPEYSGYVHCLGRGCPVCGKGIRIQSKLFIPFYHIEHGDLEFFDRSNYFQPQLFNEVFSKYPNPSEYVFRITRHGMAGSTDTKYTMTAIARNTVKTFDQICSELHLTFPECYSLITRELSAPELTSLLSETPAGTYGAPAASYEVKPRGGSYNQVPAPTDADMPPMPSLPDLPPEDFTDEEGPEDTDNPPF